MKKITVTKKEVAKVQQICRLEHAALLKTAEAGKPVLQFRIDVALHQYESYLKMLKEYAVVRRREITAKAKRKPKEGTES